MLDRVGFELLSEDGLSGVRWSFFLLRETLVVDCYEEFTRESKRHKPKVTRSWSRLNSRDSLIKQSAVPLTAEVERRAKDAFLRQVEETLKVGFQNA